jgi:hypothetical protein
VIVWAEVPVKATVPPLAVKLVTFHTAPATFSVPAGAERDPSGVPLAPIEPPTESVLPLATALASSVPPPVTFPPIVCPVTLASLSVPVVRLQLPLQANVAVFVNVAPAVLFSVRFAKVDPVKSAVWAVVPLRVTVPEELKAPPVLEMLPPTFRAFATIGNVPAVKTKFPVKVIAEGETVPEVFKVRFAPLV